MAQISARRRKIGHLDTLYVEGRPEAPTIVLFHGYGAEMSDLASLAGSLQAPKNTNWVFPNGHIAVPLGDQYEGRAWFPISIAALENQGGAIDLSQLVPPGLKRAREMALGLIEKLDVPMDRLLVGGFSQGAMLATDLVMHLQKPPAGLAILSGTLVNSEVWGRLALAHPGYRFFQSHGLQDSILPFAMAQKLETLLKGAGWQGSLQKFSGGHEIPPEVTIQLGAFIRKLFS